MTEYKKCEGCEECRHWSWCSLRPFTFEELGPCPCWNCLVKSMCHKLCEDYNEWYKNEFVFEETD